MPDPDLNRTPFRDGTRAEPLSWWPRERLDVVARIVHGAWSSWTQDWILAELPKFDAGIAGLAHEHNGLASAHWDPLGARSGAAAWVDVRYRSVENVRDAMFGRDDGSTPSRASDGIAMTVAAQAWTAWAAALRQTLHLESSEEQPHPGASAFKPWSGCVLVTAPNGAPLAHSLLLNAQCVRALLGAPDAPAHAGFRPPLANVSPLAEALSEHRMLIRAELAGCELGLGELEMLGIGDIVPLPHALHDPLLVSTRTGVPFCAAFLGRREAWKAIELVGADRAAQQIEHNLQAAQ